MGVGAFVGFELWPLPPPQAERDVQAKRNVIARAALDPSARIKGVSEAVSEEVEGKGG